MEAKVVEKEKARELRRNGLSLQGISIKLGVSKSSVSTWVRDIPQPEKFTNEFRRTRKEKRLARLEKEKEERKKAKEAENIYRTKTLPLHIASVAHTGETVYTDLRVLSGDGRWMIHPPENYKGTKYIKDIYIYEHRYITEQHLGRYLGKNESVHHKNGNKLDNRLENLELMYNEDHARLHGKLKDKMMVTLQCAYCKKYFEREKRQIRKNIKTHSVAYLTQLSIGIKNNLKGCGEVV